MNFIKNLVVKLLIGMAAVIFALGSITLGGYSLVSLIIFPLELGNDLIFWRGELPNDYLYLLPGFIIGCIAVGFISESISKGMKKHGTALFVVHTKTITK